MAPPGWCASVLFPGLGEAWYGAAPAGPDQNNLQPLGVVNVPAAVLCTLGATA